MTHRITAATAVVGALVVAVGYAVGTSQNFAAAAAETTAPAADTTLVTVGTVQMAEFSADQRKEMEGIIHNYLIANPEVITEALTELQRRRDVAEQAAQVKTIEDSSASIFASQNQIVLGNPDGKVTLVEFFDYNCTYCRRAEADMKKLIATEPNLKIVLKQFPVLGPGSVEAAKVAVALQMTAPEKYADFHDAMLEEPGQVNGAKALAVAQSLGIDPEALKAKLDSDEVKANIAESYTLANKLNLTGTPSYVTHKEVVVGAVGYDTLKAKIEALAGACTTQDC